MQGRKSRGGWGVHPLHFSKYPSLWTCMTGRSVDETRRSGRAGPQKTGPCSFQMSTRKINIKIDIGVFPISYTCKNNVISKYILTSLNRAFQYRW